MNLAQLLIQRISEQKNPHIRREAEFGIIDEASLPLMEETLDWKASATGQWGPEEMPMLQHTKPSELAQLLVDNGDTFVTAVAVAEVIMHGDDRRAGSVTQALLQRDPDLEPALTAYFGSDILGQLKSDNGS